MNIPQILREIDGEITRLQHIREVLRGAGVEVATTPKRGRPKGSGNKASKTAAKKRTLSAEGRKAIADAMKRRWAEKRKQLASKLRFQGNTVKVVITGAMSSDDKRCCFLTR